MNWDNEYQQGLERKLDATKIAGATMLERIKELEAENIRLCAEVSNRNRRALEGDEAVKALNHTHDYYEDKVKKLEQALDVALEALEKSMYPQKLQLDAVAMLKEMK